MKLRASFFNGTVFKKNLTRFAPTWVLYTLYVLIYVFLSTLSSTDRFAVDYAEIGIQSMTVLNFFYAFLVAQLLFGDLYQSRLCSGIHAMPIRRECLFFTNIVTGLIFLLIPIGVLNILSALTTSGSIVTGSAMIVPRVFLGQFLSYVCFFGIAVLSTLCVGKRFAAVLVYGLLNFGSYLIYGLVEVLYTSDYYGVTTPSEPFTQFSPVAALSSQEYLKVKSEIGENYYDILSGQVILGEGWGYLWICAAVGIAALVLALLVYRKRHLERAGDFITVKKLEPVFLLVYTLTCGLFFSLFWEISGLKLFLYLGIAVGWFTCLMFLKHTTRVFKWKNILGCLALMIVLGISFFVNNMDPFGIESRIPEKADVKAVCVSTAGTYQVKYYSKDASNVILLEEDSDIEAVLRLHTLALEEKAHDTTELFYDYDSELPVTYYCVSYALEDGTTLLREYYCYSDSEAGDILRSFFTRSTCVLGITEEQAANAGKYFNYQINVGDQEQRLTAQQLSTLMAAIVADCGDGNMSQLSSLHRGEDYLGRIRLQKIFTGGYSTLSVNVYECCVHTIQWLKDNDMLKYLDTESSYYYEYYG